MNPDKKWGYCPNCAHSQRFVRVDVNHTFHLVMTMLTLGLWSISWVSAIIGRRITPWRCKHCGSHAPDFTRSIGRRSRDRTNDEQGGV